MRVSPGVSGRARVRRERCEPFTAERLEGRMLLAAAGSGQELELGDLRRGPMREVPVRAPGSVTSGLDGYQIDVNFVGAWTAAQRAAFTEAADRWGRIVTGDIPDVSTSRGVVDDLRIDAISRVIDGPRGILGQAGPEELRAGSFLPALGSMEFDTDDLPALEAGGEFVNVILHEMAHVMGLGTIWSLKGLIAGAGGPDPRYIGPNATAEFNRIFSTEGASVPVENTGGPGTRDGHWREAVFDNELMTGFLDGGRPNPISRVTAAQFIDLGYPGVVLSAADAYTPPSATPGVPDLLPGFDTGLSNADNLTRFDNSAAASALQFAVSGTVAGATVTILADGVPVGSAVAAGPTTVVSTDGLTDFADGVRLITARQIEPGKEMSAASSARGVTVDTAGPVLNSFAFHFQSSPHRLTYGFSESWQATFSTAPLTVRNLQSGNMVSFAGSYDAATNVATYDFLGLLPNADYSATLAREGVTDAAGNPLPADHFFKFFSLTGDVNRDRSVNGTDFAILAGNFGKSGQTYAAGDLNGDGSVNGTDFDLLARNFGQSLPGNSAVLAASARPQAGPAQAAPDPARLQPHLAPPARRPPPARSKQPAGVVPKASEPPARRRSSWPTPPGTSRRRPPWARSPQARVRR